MKHRNVLMTISKIFRKYNHSRRTKNTSNRRTAMTYYDNIFKQRIPYKGLLRRVFSFAVSPNTWPRNPTWRMSSAVASFCQTVPLIVVIIWCCKLLRVMMALTSRLLRCQSLMGFRALINPRFTGILSARQVSMIIKLIGKLEERKKRDILFQWNWDCIW